MTANSTRHLDICSYILHLLDKFIMSRRGWVRRGSSGKPITHSLSRPASAANPQMPDANPSNWNSWLLSYSQDYEMVVLQSSANKISKGSKYLGDDLIPVLFLMFYLVSILTFGLKSTPAQRGRNHLTVK